MKKFKVLGLLLVFTLALTACGEGFKVADETELDLAQTVVTSESEKIAFGAYSTVTLLSQTSATTNVGNAMFLSNGNGNGGNPFEVDVTLEELNTYIAMFQPFLEENDEAIKTEVLVSTNEDYEFELHYNLLQLDGTYVEYVIFYNVLEVIEEVVEEEIVEPADTEEADETEEPADTENPEDEEETEEVEAAEEALDDNTIKLEGMMIVANTEYTLVGTVSVEEGETKTVFTASNETAQVKMVEKLEDNETKFLFEVKENSEVVSRTQVKLEVTEEETSIKLKFYEGDFKADFKFNREVEEDQVVIKIMYTINGERGMIFATEQTDEEGNVYYELRIKPDGKEERIDEVDKPEIEPEDEVEDEEESEV